MCGIQPTQPSYVLTCVSPIASHYPQLTQYESQFGKHWHATYWEYTTLEQHHAITRRRIVAYTHHVEDRLAVDDGHPTFVLYLPVNDDALPGHVARPLHHPVDGDRPRHAAGPHRLVLADLDPTLRTVDV